MKLPRFFKALVGCVDSASSRFALGAVCCERVAGTAYLTATDGRQLVSVTYDDDGADAPAVLMEGKSGAKAFAAAYGGKRRPDVAFETIDGGKRAMVNGGGGSGIAEVSEGRYPRWRDVFATVPECAPVILDPELLGQALEVFKAAGVAGVRVWFEPGTDRVMLSGTAEGATIRAVVMHRASDAPGKVEKWPRFAFQPEPVAAEAVA